MTVQKINKKTSVRAATNDLVKTIGTAIQKKELNKEDREWLVAELDEMIEQLKSAKSAALPSAQ